jgi:hypothetical protein
MSGCFGNSPEDQHFQNQLESYLDSCEHHPRCPCHEDYEGEQEYDDDGQVIEPECTCDSERESDCCDAQLDRLDFSGDW